LALKIYHNPHCSKSREALQLCEEAESEIEVVEYLKTPFDEVALYDLLKKLGKKAHEIVRTKEEVYSQLELAVDSTEEEIIAAIIKYPVLLERPIVVKGARAVIGRPPENIKTLF
tara:strand:- start:1094 stop:1438 length:345 start_codon:yes stop_codon:yes gene_type:complete